MWALSGAGKGKSETSSGVSSGRQSKNQPKSRNVLRTVLRTFLEFGWFFLRRLENVSYLAFLLCMFPTMSLGGCGPSGREREIERAGEIERGRARERERESGGSGGCMKADKMNLVDMSTLQPQIAIIAGSFIRSKVTTSNNGASLREGAIGFVRRVKRGEKIDVTMEQHPAGPWTGWSSLNTANFQVLTPAEFTAIATTDRCGPFGTCATRERPHKARCHDEV